jgi:hemerythrin-like domain-containing protein
MPTLQESSTLSTSLMEHRILGHVKQALRVTLNWNAPTVSMPRKLSSLKFTIKSFQRHLERVISIEEEAGYLIEVVDRKPYLEDRIDRLAGQHRRFRSRVRELAAELGAVNEWEDDRFHLVCGDISQLLEDIDMHDSAEIELLQETLLMDEGGEG